MAKQYVLTRAVSPRRQRGQSGQALIKAMAVAIALAAGLALTQRALLAEVPEPPELPPVSLKSVAVPGPSPAVLAQFVRDRSTAIQLGKALFWDRQVGSDSKTACASCHFNAGADNRIKNQLNPALLAGDNTFQLPGPNYQFTAADFPLVRHASLSSDSPRVFEVNDVGGSQGVFNAKFIEVSSGFGPDRCTKASDDVFHGGAGFHINGLNTRRVTGRNAPSVINAVFNFRNFWDGRANNVFNGGDPFGNRNPNTLVWKRDASGVPQQISVAIASASLASQGVGPPLSAFEMSCASRAFMKVGRKLLGQTVLSRQVVASNDSVLAPLLLPSTRPTYADLVRKAFQPDYWNSSGGINVTGTDEAKFQTMDLPARRQSRRIKPPYQVSQMEANFALFFGLAIQLYQSTLIADDTPFDRYLDGDPGALNAQQIRGFNVFAGKGQCLNCHGGAELTNASFANVTNQRLERMVMGNNGEAVYDNGFYNIGVRPTAEDLGVGGVDPFGNPLSETRMAQADKAHLLGNSFDTDKEPSVAPGDRVAVDGAFKTPGLRNVEFTGPYFHNGGRATLMQVVDFYDRGGDFARENQDDLDPDITPLGLTEPQKQDLVAFMLALSDVRVRFRRAPFDHPSLCMTQGHPVNSYGVLLANGTTGQAKDSTQCLRAVGADGETRKLRRFLNLNPFQH